MSEASRERSERIQIEAAANMVKARAGFRVVGSVLKMGAAAALLSFAYYTGERAGLHQCYGESYSGKL